MRAPPVLYKDSGLQRQYLAGKNKTKIQEDSPSIGQDTGETTLHVIWPTLSRFRLEFWFSTSKTHCLREIGPCLAFVCPCQGRMNVIPDAAQQGSRYSSRHTEIDQRQIPECMQTPSLCRHAGPACSIQPWDCQNNILEVKTRHWFRGIAPVSARIQEKPLWMSFEPLYQGFD